MNVRESMAVTEVLAEERCGRLHPEDGGTCFRCRTWAGQEVHAIEDRFRE